MGNHKPCKHRRRESINGCALDMCYAIGFERVGDMPCEYCSDWPTIGRQTRNLQRQNRKAGQSDVERKTLP